MPTHIHHFPRIALVLLTTLLLFAPGAAQADVEAPPSSEPSFESIQNLELVLTVDGQPLVSQATTTFPYGQPISVSYEVRPTGSFFGDPDYPQEYQDLYFPDYLAERMLYLELWNGEPFTSEAERTAWWPIDETGSGIVALPRLEDGPHFFVAYMPNGDYRDLASACASSGYAPEECTPENMGTVTQDETSPYFALPFLSDAFFDFEDVPSGWGGIRFVQETGQELGASNVLFLPGIKASRLYMREGDGSERDLWEPGLLTDIAELAMREDGSSVNEIYTRDIVDSVYEHRPALQLVAAAKMGQAIDVYQPFMDFMDGLVSEGTLEEWRAFPYDWRYDVFDIMENGTLVAEAGEELHTVYLDEVVEELASSSPTGKVTIIGHSNGGLLAKALAIRLEEEGKAELIDRIIMVGTPQYGTPTAIGSMLHGDNESIANGLIVYANDARDATKTMPGAYGLLPSSAYMDAVPEDVATFDGSPATAPYRAAFGPSIDSSAELAQFANGSVPATGSLGSLRTPLPLSPALLARAEETHARLDAWTPPAGLELVSIVGWGQDTPYQLGYTSRAKTNCVSIFSCTTNHLLEHQIETTKNGDGTVVAHSAAGSTVDSRYFDARAYQGDKRGTVVHSSLLSAPPIQEEISDAMREIRLQRPYISQEIPNGVVLRDLTIVSAHSPANLIATDAEGRETGIVPLPGMPGFHFLKHEISDSSVHVLGEEKYLFLPKGEYDIVMNGYDNGTTTLEMATAVLGEAASTTQVFLDIPTTPSTVATFEISETGTASLPEVDINGDGTVDMRPSESPQIPTRASLFVLLKERIGSSRLPWFTKGILLHFLGKIEEKIGARHTYRPMIASMQALLSTVRGGREISKDKEDIRELMQRF